MAKIYETQEDFERDKLKEQSTRLRLDSASQGSNGLLFTIAGWMFDSARQGKPETRGWMAYVSTGAFALGLVEIIRSWMTGSKAHTLELERERMGPETVIIPPDAAIGDNHSCGCKDKFRRPPVVAQTLIDQASKLETNVLSKA